MKHRFAAGTLGTLAVSLLLAHAPLTQAAQPAAKAAIAPAVSAPQARQQLQVVADQYYDALARFEPINATESGDNRFDDQLGAAIVPAARAKQFALYRQYQKTLRAIARQQLSHQDQINYDILDYELASALSLERFPEYLLPLNQMDSMPVTLANYAGGEASQPLTSVKQYNAYLSRIGQLPAWIDQAIANMRVGMQQGIVLPKPLIESALPQFKKLVSATPQDSVYYTPIKNLPAGFSAADKERLTQTYTVIIEAKLMPALQRLERPARRRGLVPGARGVQHHHGFETGTDPRHRLEGSSAHPGTICDRGTEDGLHRPGRRPARMGLGTGKVPPIQDGTGSTRRLPQAERAARQQIAGPVHADAKGAAGLAPGA